MLTGEILITGGAGTLGTAIIKRATRERWNCRITVYSTDPAKHSRLRALYPNINAVVGDIRDFNSLLLAMTGKDIVIHAAAVKRIPDGEFNVCDTFSINVQGSMNVCSAAVALNTPHVLGISTDKACYPANAYGASKMLMERTFQEYARAGVKTRFHLVRYGNVLESNGSVIEVWKRQAQEKNPIQITNKGMTRFWLSPSQAVDYVERALEFQSGEIYIPQMPALSIGKLAEYIVGEVPFVEIPIRPGEKIHETLLTKEEAYYSELFIHNPPVTDTFDKNNKFYLLRPNTGERLEEPAASAPYTSDAPIHELTEEELTEILND